MAATQTRDEVVIKWMPQPKQSRFLRAAGLSHPFDGGKPKRPMATMIGYGGAAGGGKSAAMLIACIIYALTYPGSVSGYFRRQFTHLSGAGGAIMKSRALLTGVAKYNEKYHRWTFPNGSIIEFCNADNLNDLINKYQGTEFDLVAFDEATHFTWDMVSYIILSRMRSVKGYPLTALFGTNPGNVGHGWFKRLFVKAGEPEEVQMVEVEDGEWRSVCFIPANLSDNLILEKMDPQYRKNLEAMPEHLKKQLLEGDWEAAEGMAFTEWREKTHVIPPFRIPDEWIRFRALDWGHSKPYSVGWYAVDYDGRMYKYRELYGYGGRPDVGSKEDPEDVAIKIMEMEKGEDISYAVADDAIFGSRQDNSPTIAEQFATAFGSNAVHWAPVGKGSGSRVSGKLEVHHRLKMTPGEEPMLLFFNTCKHTIRTLPNLVLDEKRLEDVDTTMEDHAYDETRYACMSRPITPKRKPPEESRIEKHKKKLAKQRQLHDPTKRIL